MNTTAIVFERPGEVALRDVALPPPRPGQAQVATHYSTISAGTEGCRRERVAMLIVLTHRRLRELDDHRVTA